MAYSTEILNDNPAGYWKLDETSGTTAVDETSNSNDGTYQNAPTLGQDGVDGTSVDFDGVDQYVHVPRSASLDLTTAWSLEAWFLADTAPNNLGIIAEEYSTTEGNVQFELGFSADRGDGTAYPMVGFYNSGWYKAEASSEITLGYWHHMVGTWDGTTLRLYLDGTEVASSTPAGSVPTGTLDFFIGRRHDENGGNPYFDGRIDEAAIYPTALSATRVDAHYDAGKSKYHAEIEGDTPEVYYRLGESTGSTMHDEMGNADGTYAAGARLGDAGAIVNDPDTAAHAASDEIGEFTWTFDLTTGFTFESWVKSTNTTWPNHTLFFDSNDSAAFRVLGISGSTTLRVRWDSDNHDVDLGANGIDISAYHHYAVTIDGGVSTLFVDGTQISTHDHTTAASSLTTPISIGGNEGLYSAGPMDEVAFYDYVLTGTQIQSHYDTGSTVSTDISIAAPTAKSHARAVSNINYSTTFAHVADWTLSGDATYDSTNNRIKLTPSLNTQSGFAQWDYDLAGFRQWTAEFDFTWDGTGDEIVFHAHASAVTGGQDSDGYKVRFDHWNDLIELTAPDGTVLDQLAYTFNDTATYTAKVQHDNGQFIVSLDGIERLNHTDATPTYPGELIAFGAWTGGGASADHYVNDLSLVTSGESLTVTTTSNATVSSSAATATADALAPTVSATTDASVDAVAATGTAQALAPAISTSSNATVAAQAATASAQALSPSLTTVQNVSVAAQAATATAQAPAPTVSTGQNTTVSATAATATADAVAPSVWTGTIISAVTATASGEALAPSIETVSNVSVSASTATAEATANAPDIDAETRVRAPTATGTATAIAPTVHVSTEIAVPTATASADALVPTLPNKTIVAPPATATAEGRRVTVTGDVSTDEAVLPYLSNLTGQAAGSDLEATGVLANTEATAAGPRLDATVYGSNRQTTV